MSGGFFSLLSSNETENKSTESRYLALYDRLIQKSTEGDRSTGQYTDLPSVLGYIDEFDFKMKAAADGLIVSSPATKDEEHWRLAVVLTLLYGEMNISVETETVDFSTINSDNKKENIFLSIIKKHYVKKRGTLLTLISTKGHSDEYEPFAFSSEYIVTPVKKMRVKILTKPECPFPLDENNNIDLASIETNGTAHYLNDKRADNLPLLYGLLSALSCALKCDEFSSAHYFIKRFLLSLPQMDSRRYNGVKKIAGTPIVEIPGYTPFIPFDRNSVFLEKICFLGDGGAGIDQMFMSCYGRYDVVLDNSSKCSALLPFQKGFIEKYLSDEQGVPTDIAINLKPLIKFIDLTTAYVAFGLRIGADVVLLAHTYSDGDFIIKPEHIKAGLNADLPGVAVWPDKSDPSFEWKDYYIFQSEDAADKVNLCKGIWFNLPPFYKLKNQTGFVTGKDGNLFKTISTDTFPYFLYAEHNGEYCGAVILRPNGELDRFRHKSMIVGMDFGTTSSAAFAAEEPDNDDDWLTPEKLDFSDNSVLFAISPNTSRYISRVSFMPRPPELREDEWKSFSFFTILHIFGTNSSVALIDANILFVSIGALEYPKFGTIPDNIKWNDKNTAYADLFIEQFVKLCAWKVIEKGARNISFRMSYPSSLTKASDFEKKVLNALAKLSYPSQGVTATTESRAATLYFQNPMIHFKADSLDAEHSVDIEQGIVLVDIGGGSVDFSIVQNFRSGRLNFKFIESSLAFAGKSILLKALKAINISAENFKQFMGYIGAPENIVNNADRFISQTDKTTEQYAPFEIYCEALLAYLDDDDFIHSLNQNAREHTLMIIRKIILFNLSAVAYYAGKLANEADRDYVPGYGEGFSFARSITFAVCGNGSKLLNWMISEDEMALMQKAFLCAAGERASAIEVYITKSENPKSEVACGLVCARQLDKVQDTAELSFFDRVIVDSSGTRDFDQIDYFILYFKGFFDFLWSEKQGIDVLNVLAGGMFKTENDVSDFLMKLIKQRRGKTDFSTAYAYALEKINEIFRQALIIYGAQAESI